MTSDIGKKPRDGQEVALDTTRDIVGTAPADHGFAGTADHGVVRASGHDIDLGGTTEHQQCSQ